MQSSYQKCHVPDVDYEEIFQNSKKMFLEYQLTIKGG
jgi:hypothetical protein